MKHGSRRLAGVATTAFVAVMAASAAGWAVVRPAVVFQPDLGSNYVLYMADTHEQIVLQGTAGMADAVVGDVDGDGLENDLLYRDSSAGGLRYYMIPPDGSWHPENVRVIPGSHLDGVPLTVLRQGGPGTLGLAVYKSASAGQSYAARVSTLNLLSLGRMDKAFAVDARIQGFRGDLLWWADGLGTFWRSGTNGPDLPSPYPDWLPLGGGSVIPNQPSRTMAFYSPSANSFYMADAAWNSTRIDGSNGAWGPGNSWPIVFGDVDSDNLDEIVFVNCPGYPLQWYSVPSNGGPWSSGNWFCDNDTWFGWRLHGVARIDIPTIPITPVARVADLRALPDGEMVRLEAKVRTLLVRELDQNYQPTTTGFYIEEADRTSGIRVTGATSARENDLVTVEGKLATVNGERVITNSVQTVLPTQSPVSPVGVAIKSLYGPGTPLTGLVVRIAGTITDVDPEFAWFGVSDGSGRPIKVYCPDISRTEGFVVVTGCVGAETDGDGIVPVIRVPGSDSIVYVADSSIPEGPLAALSDFRGIVYTEAGRPVGMPLGGLGAGDFEVSSQGSFMEFSNVNNWAARIPSIPGSGLWLVYKTGGTTQVLPLSGGRVRFEGNFPFARLTFPDLPVDVTLWCWSPLILHDTRRSGYPAAIFDAEIRNSTSQPAEVGLLLSYGTDYGGWLQNLAGPDLQGAPVDILSTSAPYNGQNASGISFSTTAAIDQAWLDQRYGQIRQNLEDSYLRSYDFTTLDIRQACNRSYLNSPFGTDPGNAPLKFAGLQPGARTLYGFPFQVVDDAANGGKSIVMAGPETSTQSVTIPVAQQADCIFFLGNCAGWAASGTAEYVVRYTDGTQFTVPLRNGYEIGDWMGGSPVYLPARITCGNGIGGTSQIFLFAVPTDGTKVVQSVEVRKSGQIAPIVFAVTIGRLSSTPLPDAIRAARQADIDRMMASAINLKLAPNTDAGYTLAARTLPGAQVLTYQVANAGALPNAVVDSQTQPQPGATVYAVEQRFSLSPGERAVAGLVCSWYAPNHYSSGGYRFGHAYENWFSGSPAVAEEIARDHDTLLRDTKKHYDVIATSTLPKWYREMLQSNFYLMPVGTWYTKDGIAFTYESPTGCALFGTMDVRYYGSFTMLAGYPELDATVLREFAGVQHADGFIPHDLGASAGLQDTYQFPTNTAPVSPNPNPGAYAGYWTNLPIKFCLEVARHYQWTGDTAFLQAMWPHVKRAVTWIDAQDVDDDGLPETSYGYDGWSMIDKCGYDANQWNAMLIAVAKLADVMGESQYAAQLRATQLKAVAQIERLVWTGSYYKQSATADGGGLDWVSLLQVAGTWYADILGFDDGLSGNHISSALQTMDQVLGGNALYGLTDALRPDGSSTGSGIADIEAAGWQYFYASHCMYRGLDDIGLRVADEVWRGLTVEKGRIPWCQEEWINDPPHGVIPYFLLRDMRMGATMVMSYAAAGLRMDVPAGTAAVRPAEWVWKDPSFVLPVLMPKWLGQVRYDRQQSEERYEITNLLPAIGLNSLKLRSQYTDTVSVTVSGEVRQVQVGTDGTVDVGPVSVGTGTTVVTIGLGH